LQKLKTQQNEKQKLRIYSKQFRWVHCR